MLSKAPHKNTSLVQVFHPAFIPLLLLLLTAKSLPAQTVSDFSEMGLDPESYWNGSDGSGGFTSGAVFFPNHYSDWGGGMYSWSGFSVSNMTDNETPGFLNQYSAYTGGGYDGQENYAVVYVSDPATYEHSIFLMPDADATDMLFHEIVVTNSTWTAISMRDGDDFTKQFGGPDGNDPDWFLLTIVGWMDGTANEEEAVEFYLADYRFEDNDLNYIVDTWESIPLESLGPVDSLEFRLSSTDVGAWGMNTPAYFCIGQITMVEDNGDDNGGGDGEDPEPGPFSPPAGQEGSTAIHKDSTAFVGWATACEVFRGYRDISQPELGLVTAGSCANTLGKAGEGGTLSLGDGGHAILSFDPPITNGPGWDFAVFENAFDDYFLELAFVEVSSDGENFFRFPNTSLTPTDTQVETFGTLDATHIHNLAGKYRVHHGTPFDLDTLAGTPGLDIQRITHVKIIDVVGSIDPDYASHDSHGNEVNDPWPTPFHTGGFDLDAIGVIHATGSETGEPWIQQGLEVRIHHSHISLLTSQDGPIHLEVYDMQGRRIFSHREALAPAGNQLISLHDKGLLPGVYVLRLQAGNQHHSQRFFYNGMR